jgi:hypothetical protein
MTTYSLEFFVKKVSGAESLDLNGHLIGDAGARFLAEALKKNRTVAWLDLQYNRIGPEVSASLKPINVVVQAHILYIIMTWRLFLSSCFSLALGSSVSYNCHSHNIKQERSL